MTPVIALLLLAPAPAAPLPPPPDPAPIHQYLKGAAPPARCGERGADGEILVCGRADLDRQYRLDPDVVAGVAPLLPDATVRIGDTRLDLHGHRAVLPQQAVSNRVMVTVTRPF